MRTKKLGFIETNKSIRALPYLDLMLAGSKADKNRLQTYNSNASTTIPPPTHSVSTLANLPHLFQRTDTPNVRTRRAEWPGACGGPAAFGVISRGPAPAANLIDGAESVQYFYSCNIETDRLLWALSNYRRRVPMSGNTTINKIPWGRMTRNGPPVPFTHLLLCHVLLMTKWTA